MNDDRYSVKPGVFHDKTGLTYGRLTVLYYERSKWVCKCECGNTTSVAPYSLNKGLTTSCGCLQKETLASIRTTHGMTNSKEYRAWRAMLNRCNRPENDNYGSYGGRGIAVCERWVNSFENFYSDMGPAPSDNHTVDRLDGEGNYEPGNCRWATMVTQNNNRSSNRMVDYNGTRISVAELARQSDIPYNTVRNRIAAGLTAEEAIGKRWLQKKN